MFYIIYSVAGRLLAACAQLYPVMKMNIKEGWARNAVQDNEQNARHAGKNHRWKWQVRWERVGQMRAWKQRWPNVGETRAGWKGERQKGINAADSWAGVTEGQAQDAVAKPKSRFHLQKRQRKHGSTHTPSENSRLIQLLLLFPAFLKHPSLVHLLPFAICSLYLPLSFLSNFLSS